MKFHQLAVLLPSYSIESFDLLWKEEDAEQLLSAWSTLWHPLLLASARAIPRWLPAGSPPQEPSGHLIILPNCAESLLPDNWLTEAEASGACVLQNLPHRDEMVIAALQQLEEDQPSVDPDLAGDFLALGFCHFQVEVLTRKLRYMSNLDETSLSTALMAAADEAVKGDSEAARRHLQSGFDRLHEAREYFYPTAARLLDLTLVAPSTLGSALQTELANGLPRNLLIVGEVVQQMAQREPATLDALKQALAENRAGLIGGENVEIPLPLIGPEAIEDHLHHGLAVYERQLDRRPKIFGRRRFGLTPALPQILQRKGFIGALHCTLDDGQFPTSPQSRIQWEGLDGTTIEALGCLPLDAGRAESFLPLAESLSNAMNLDQSSTVMFAHWPGRACRWYDDLRRIAAYGSVLGAFLTIDEYFEQTASTGQQNRYQPDQYRAPYLKQDVTAGRRDPISRWVRYFRRQRMLEALAAVRMLAAGGNGDCGKGEGENDEWAAAVENSLIAEKQNSDELDDQLSQAIQRPLVGFAQSVVGHASSPQRGCLVVNPDSFSRQIGMQPLPVNVPAMGFSWVGPGAAQSPSAVSKKDSSDRGRLRPILKKMFGHRKPQPPPPLAEENVLRNEFFEVHFDPHTGAIRTISDYYSRDPRLAQQIALRLPSGGEPGSDQNYSIMAADELLVTSNGTALGEIQSRGRLMDREGRCVARFHQTTRAWRGSRILEIEIHLDIERQPGANPWNSYYAVRFAWKDENAVVCRDVNRANLPTELTQFESPCFVDIRHGKQHTTLLTVGLPYHRRFGQRRLDTLLVVQGETADTFRMGIGIDVPHPVSAALDFGAPPLILPDQPAPSTPSGWLFHLDCRNVLATHWEPLWLNGDVAEKASDITGFRVRLLETDGAGVHLKLRCFRNVASARQITVGDNLPTQLTVGRRSGRHPDRCASADRSGSLFLSKQVPSPFGRGLG